MVRIDTPPPRHDPTPIFRDALCKGTYIIRIFDPTDHGATATGFRHWGPRHRFDHHRLGTSEQPTHDPDRGIYYAALSLEGCLVELFGDLGLIDYGARRVAKVQLLRDLHLLDLRKGGAMRAGANAALSNAALSKAAERPFSQEWSCYVYEHEAIYTRIDGLIYYNAHNDDDAIALYERATDALYCPDDQVMWLDNPLLRPAVVRCALNNGLIAPPE